nr:hypothetical protein [Tanacetum cinerariifolium]
MESLNSNSQERESCISCNKCKTKQKKVAWNLFNYFIHISRRNERQMPSKEGKVDSSKALDACLVVIECSAIESHTKQSEPIYDTYLLKKVDSNTTPDSTNMSHKGGEIDQDAEKYQVKNPLLNAEFFKTKDMVEKEVYNELSNRFLQLKKRFDVKDDLPKPVTPNYLPKVRESVFVKPYHVIASGSSRNSSNESYGSNDMAHKYYLEERCYIQNFSDNNSSHDLPSVHLLIDHHCCYECGNSLNDFFCYQCTCKFCGNEAHVGYNCPAKVPSVQTLLSFPQQYPCCEDSRVTHEPYQCQPKNHDYYNEQNSCFASNSFVFDQSQPQQYTVNHPIFNAHNDYLDSQIQLNSTLAKITEQMTSITSLCEMACQFVRKKLKEKQLEEEQATKAKNWKLPVCYDDDDDEERSDSLATKSDEVINFGVENLIPILSESEGIPEHKCDVPFHDNSPPLDISKDQIEDLFESNEAFSSTNDDSFSFDKIDYVEASPPDSELVSSEVMEIVTPEVDAFLAVEDEPTSSQFPKSYLDSEGDMLLLEAFLNDDHSSDFTTKSSSTSLNSLLEETNNFIKSLPEFTTFSKSCSDEDVLEKIVSIPLFEEEIIPMKSLRAHDSSFPISSKIDSLLDEDILILKDLPRHNTLSFAEKESFYFDISPFSRPLAKPPDGDTGILNIKMMGDVYDQKAFMHKLMFTLASHQEKSPDLLSHRCGTVKKFNTHRSHLNKCPMLFHRQNNPLLDVLLFYFYPP